MRYKLPLAIAAAGMIAATASVAAADPAPRGVVQDRGYWAGVDWDDDDDDRRRYGPMPVPSVEALRRAGMVRVEEVERDDGRIEVEGRDARGRELKIVMDARGQRVLSARIDRDDDYDD